MNHPTRRNFALAGIAAGAAATLPMQLFGRNNFTFGVQLYTVRNVIGKNPEQVLRDIEGAGYKEIETGTDDLDAIWPALQKTSLKPVGVHLTAGLFLHTPEKLPAEFDRAKKYGFEYVGCPWVDVKDRNGAEGILKLAGALNQAGKLAAERGLKFFYHNHAFEFAPAEGGSGTLFDLLMKNTDPKLVSWEMDIFWVSVTGNDPIDLFHKYPGRAKLLHIKDLAANTPKRFDEQVARTAFKEAGQGTLDLKKILRAATDAGVKHFFVEQDQTPGDPVASLKLSASYLKALEF